MKILITGSNGFIGKNLIFKLISQKKHQIFQFNRRDSLKKLQNFINKADIIFHLAGVNRAVSQKEFITSNVDLTKNIIKYLNNKKKKTKIIFTSSNLIKNKLKTNYTDSKLNAENLIKKKLSKNHKHQIFRLPNIFGKWSKPNYNSVVATFCNNISRNLPVKIIENKIIKLAYIDDLIKIFINIIEFKSKKKLKLKTYSCKIDQLLNKIKKIKKNRNLILKNFAKSNFDKYLYSTYLTYMPIKDITYKLHANKDYRGDFVELFKYPSNGQISYFSINSKVLRGGHYHNVKVEKFFLITGKIVFNFYDLNSKKKFSIKINSKDHLVLETIPGYVHSIKNNDKTVAKGVIWSNEVFNKNNPDTIYYNLNEKKKSLNKKI